MGSYANRLLRRLRRFGACEAGTQLAELAVVLPVMLVLSLLGFAGSVSIARFVADRDKAIRWDVETQRRPASRVSRRPERQEGP